MGTPDFATSVLSLLSREGHEIVGVYTQPDRPSGRSKNPKASNVKTYAIKQGIPTFEPETLKSDRKALENIKELNPDLIVVAAYGLYIPTSILELPSLGCLNIHPSLLPLHRGPSPVATALLNGDSVTGVSIMQLTSELDSGPIVAQKRVDIKPEESSYSLTRRLFELGGELLVDILPSFRNGDIQPYQQNHSDATFTEKLTRGHGNIDWHLDANSLVRQTRAYDPWPSSFSYWNGKLLKIIGASVYDIQSESLHPRGEVVSLDTTVGVRTGRGILIPKILHLEGKNPMDATEFLNGHKNFIGSILGK
ncbi:MAG: methionyl-tRNA formyltransferase [Chloroflexota bacterium]|nr:methionyl-tRNA formyltransferase [Chloroflexota bacterium]